MSNHKPEILAPAGDQKAMLAAFAAGADAVYLGLKHFSARMEAENFSVSQLSRLAELAHAEGRRVFVAINSLLKPGDPEAAGKLIAKLTRDVAPDAIICQDLAVPTLARQAGYQGELHISTLANLTHPAGFAKALELSAKRVILPREINIDELRLCSDKCPPELDLEFFIHGALCYSVSGRCWWSSYMGGKSGLRGRCVQPCRRYYRQGQESGRFFSCQDFSLAERLNLLLSLPKVVSWKIEGRKKGPHYVYHVVAAYRLLRDHPKDLKAKKEAQDLLALALGRPNTPASFWPQRPVPVLQPGRQTGSGLFVGKVFTSPTGAGFKTRLDLAPGDFLRVGYEDEPWHFTAGAPKHIPKGGSFRLQDKGKKSPRPGTPVFLIDRREARLNQALAEWEKKLSECQGRPPASADFQPSLPPPARPLRPLEMVVSWGMGDAPGLPKGAVAGFWLTGNALKTVPKGKVPHAWWWLPPVIWPDEEEAVAALVSQALGKGARYFVLGSPWQVAFFPKTKGISLWAGPFCNISNPVECAVLLQWGFSGAFASVELSAADLALLAKQSPLPLGIVINGWWPMGLSRLGLAGIKANQPFQSPKNEVFWSREHGQNLWLYPGWPLDISTKRRDLQKMGFSLFAILHEELPKSVPLPTRASNFNWDLTLL